MSGNFSLEISEYITLTRALWNGSSYWVLPLVFWQSQNLPLHHCIQTSLS